MTTINALNRVGFIIARQQDADARYERAVQAIARAIHNRMEHK